MLKKLVSKKSLDPVKLALNINCHHLKVLWRDLAVTTVMVPFQPPHIFILHPVQLPLPHDPVAFAFGPALFFDSCLSDRL